MLRRSRTDRMIAGVCGGLAESMGVDSSTIRLVTVLLVLFGGLSVWIYIIAAIIMPLED